jgi:type IV pilus assembly protein PilB
MNATRFPLWSSALPALLMRGGIHQPRLVAMIEAQDPEMLWDLAGWVHAGEAQDRATASGPWPLGLTLAVLQAAGLSDGGRILVLGLDQPLLVWLASQVADDVVVVDEHPDRVATCGGLERPGNVEVVLADPRAGHAEGAFWDAIVVARDGFELNLRLLDQIAPGGSLLLLTGAQRIQQQLVRVRQTEHGQPQDDVLGRVGTMCLFGEAAMLLGAVGASELRQGLLRAAEHNHRLGDALSEVGALDPQEMVRVLAAQRGMRTGTVEEILRRARSQTIAELPRGYVHWNSLLPLGVHDGVLAVATPDENAQPWELQHAARAHDVEMWLVTQTDFARLLRAVDLGVAVADEGEAAPTSTQASADDLVDLLDVAVDAEVESRYRMLFDTLLLDAMGERASDIHIEKYGDRVRVRLRIDGDLRDMPRMRLSPVDMAGVVNVIKIGSSLDISERRRPQGGRMRRLVSRQVVDMRVQTQPSLHGEHIVIRLLIPQSELITIESLGFLPQVAAKVRRLIDAPAGMVLVVGPTGSGKTTTLYSALQILVADTTRKVITVEDPIEYSLDGIQQTQTRPEIHIHFADAMRAFVREDPDVIFVGEIRDAETALEAMRASQTGHLVLSTLHCNDAIDAVQRLRDLGMHDNTISSELMAVIAQHLARRICDGCLEEATPNPELFAEVFPDGPPEDFRCYRGRGCSRCNQRGTRGRVAVAEFLQTGHSVRRGISRGWSVDELRELALHEGLVTMREAALFLVHQGRIAFDEMKRLLPPDRLGPEGNTARPPVERPAATPTS